MHTIGFLGPKGTFSHEAYLRYQSQLGVEALQGVSVSNISDILHGIHRGEFDAGIVPIENSLEGAINVTMDTLAFDVQLYIQSELILAVSQNLLVKKHTTFAAIKRVLSHPQPLGQCREYLRKNFSSAILENTLSTAEAAILTAKGSGDMAAIGTQTAAEVYGLEILDKDIQDGQNNHTRFVIVSQKDTQSTGNDKTSLAFSTLDKPGSLYRILDIFNLWDINMTRIESRPAKNKLGEYIFFVDILGHYSDEDVQSALTMVKRKSSFFKFLGSYPVYQP